MLHDFLHATLQRLSLIGITKNGLALGSVGLLLLAILPPLVQFALVRFGRVEANFRGDQIPVGVGLTILFWAIPMALLDRWRFPDRGEERVIWVVCLTGYALLGWIDDVWGDKKIKGLRGHLKALATGRRVTTGLIKAAGGLMAAGWLASRLAPGNLFLIGLMTLTIALSANAMNLFDLRPGRAGAVFLFFSISILASLFWQAHQFFVPGLVYVVIPAALVWERDSRALAMLGDTGSNLLGGALGLSVCLYAPLPLQIVALSLLIALHLLGERASISKVIEDSPFLSWLDALTGERKMR